MLAIDEYRIVNGTYYDPNTSDEVIRVCERSRLNNTRIRLYLGDRETGRCWLEEYDVEGYVGRSLGPVKIPLLAHNRRSLGGCGILDHCVIKIKESRGGRVLYQHPSFHVGEMTIQPSDLPEYSEIVAVDGQVHARFRKAGEAEKWIRKMHSDTELKAMKGTIMHKRTTVLFSNLAKRDTIQLFAKRDTKVSRYDEKRKKRVIRTIHEGTCIEGSFSLPQSENTATIHINNVVGGTDKLAGSYYWVAIRDFDWYVSVPVKLENS